MLEITKDNITVILDTYNKFHLGTITEINYDVDDSIIIMNLQVIDKNQKQINISLMFKEIIDFEINDLYKNDTIYNADINFRNNEFTFIKDTDLENNNLLITATTISIKEKKV